ncbi:hypothetical protein SDC9_80073 [bioreactor metagenome]|uniref:Uncharacterized protein n=1 Tax=bioreactor metagenome TaxID=1076179 RepID=A0A644YYP7_9ZZZZ
MNDRVIQKRKRVRAAPPAGGVGRVPPVRGPAVALVFVETVKVANVLRVAHAFEHAHVLAARKHKAAFERGVDVDHRARDVFLFVKLAVAQAVRLRGDKIAPDQRLVRDFLCLARRNFREVDHLEHLIQIPLAGSARVRIGIKNVQRVKLLVLRIDAVTGKSAPKAVGALVHAGHGVRDETSRNEVALLRKDSRDRTAGRNADFTFPQRHSRFSLRVRFLFLRLFWG